jgi:predicted RND superfamily exporter protein
VAIFLRSPGLALAGMIPAVLPIVVTLGAMGWAGMSLDMGRAMIAAVLLGIAVDDSIHVLRHYQLRRVAGDDPNDAIRSAVLHVGRAIVTTSLSLSLGFLALAASAWQSIASFGLFVSLAILGALAAALVVLPALVFAWAKVRRVVPLELGRAAPSWQPGEERLARRGSSTGR